MRRDLAGFTMHNPYSFFSYWSLCEQNKTVFGGTGERSLKSGKIFVC